jgi:probable HAF family extracellular repeat protein
VLPTLGGREAYATDINEVGQVAGYSLTADGNVHAVVWEGTEAVDVTEPSPPGEPAYDQAIAINRNGTIAGRGVFGWLPPLSKGWVRADGERTTLPPGDTVPPSVTLPTAVNARDEVLYTAFDSHVLNNPVSKLWRHGEVIDAPSVAEGPFVATDLNDRGLVVGNVGFGPSTAYTWRPGEAPRALRNPTGVTAVRALALNNRGDVLGRGTNPSTGIERAYVWRNGRPTDLGTLGGERTGMAATSANSTPINSWGHAVGYSETTDGQAHAFIWRNGRMTDLGTLGGAQSQATAVNDLGQVIGASETASGEQHPFLWQNGQMLDLSTLPGLEGVVQIIDLNNRGQVVVVAYGPEGPRPAVVSVPPL